MKAALNNELYARITALSEQANEALESGNARDAELPLQEGLRLLPSPKSQWEAYTWLNASLGETYFLAGRYQEARQALYDAVNGPDGHTNPFVLLRLGQVFLELKETEKAREYLMRAKILVGDEIFKNENPKYLAFLKSYSRYP